MSKIALLLSGGVDSSVALHMLCQAGEKPDCYYIYIGPDEEDTYSCTSDEDVEMCRIVTARYGVNFEIIDLHKEYWNNVVKYTMDKVSRGYTPNPDVMCNTIIKFGHSMTRSDISTTILQQVIMLLVLVILMPITWIGGLLLPRIQLRTR